MVEGEWYGTGWTLAENAQAFIGGKTRTEKKDTNPARKLGQLLTGTLHLQGSIGGGTMRVLYLHVNPRGE